jgi:hypothetical protein
MAEFVDTFQAFIDALQAGAKKVGLRYVSLSDDEASLVAKAIEANSGTQRLR